MKKWYWLSFSHKGVNQGVCNVQAYNKRMALQRTIDLGIHPPHDDISILELLAAELEPDRLFSKQEMLDRKYDTVNYRR